MEHLTRWLAHGCHAHRRCLADGGGPPPNLFRHNANGTGDEERLFESPESLRTQDWTLDGKLLLYLVNSNDLSSKTRFDLWVRRMTGDPKPEPFLSTSSQEGSGQFSPDGKWIAYTSDESRDNEVYVQSYPAGGAKRRVSSTGGNWVRWRRDGGELFYIAPDRKLMSVAVQAISGSLKVGTPRALFTIPFTLSTTDGLSPYTYDVTQDGQQFLVLVPAGDAASPPMTVILDWQAELSTAKE
jgi:Tol biopolymer transport system component